MRKSYLAVLLAAAILSLGLMATNGVAQVATAPAVRPPSPGGTIALLDVNYIFKKHVRFKALMEDMKAEVQRAEAEVKRDRETLRKLAEQLQEFQKGSPQYKRQEEQMAEFQAKIGVRVQMQKKDFLEREAKIYYQVYQEIRQAVYTYAQANGISAVLRFNGDPADVNNPQTVIREINKQVVWYAQHLDITPVILGRLNQPNPTPGPGPVGLNRNQNVPFNR